MKLALLALVFLTGCVSAIPYSYQEQCALQGMKLIGVDQGQSSGSAYAYSGGYSASGVSHGYSESIRCNTLESEADKDMARKINYFVKPKVDYNTEVSHKRLINGFSYIIWPIGLGVYFYYDSQRDDVIKAYMSQDVNSWKSSIVNP